MGVKDKDFQYVRLMAEYFANARYLCTWCFNRCVPSWLRDEEQHSNRPSSTEVVDINSQNPMFPL